MKEINSIAVGLNQQEKVKIKVVKKLLAGTWYKLGDEFEVIREEKVRFGRSNLLVEVYVVLDPRRRIEDFVLKQDGEIVKDSGQLSVIRKEKGGD